MKFGTHIHDPQRTNCNNFDLLIFNLAPSFSQYFNQERLNVYLNSMKGEVEKSLVIRHCDFTGYEGVEENARVE